jgi:hypothetical protein
VRLIYLSGWKGILVARLDAIVIELRVSKGPVKTTRVSSARVDRVCATSDAAHGRSLAARLG